MNSEGGSEHLTELSFEVPGQPFGKQRPRVIHNGAFSKAYTPKETVAYENLVKMNCAEAAGGRMFADGDMLEVFIYAYFGIPKSASKKKREQMIAYLVRPTKKPDIDNIQKIICDSLNKVAYHDDSSIVEAHVNKYYSERPRVSVIIKSLGKGI